MKNYIVLLKDRQPIALENDLLQMHTDYIKKLYTDGHLRICGPFIDNEGAFMVLKADTREKIEDFINDAPLIKYNYYASYEIHEFLEAQPSSQWLVN